MGEGRQVGWVLASVTAEVFVVMALLWPVNLDGMGGSVLVVVRVWCGRRDWDWGGC